MVHEKQTNIMTHKLVQNTIESLKFVGANILGLLKINLQIHGDVILCMSFYLYRVVSKTQGAGNSPANNALITLLSTKHYTLTLAAGLYLLV